MQLFCNGTHVTPPHHTVTPAHRSSASHHTPKIDTAECSSAPRTSRSSRIFMYSMGVMIRHHHGVMDIFFPLHVTQWAPFLLTQLLHVNVLHLSLSLDQSAPARHESDAPATYQQLVPWSISTAYFSPVMADLESMNVTVLTRPAATVPDHVPDYDKIDDPTATPTLHSLREEDMERRTSATTQRSDLDRTMTLVEPEDPRVTGIIASPRGMLVLMVTCTAQLLDLILCVSRLVVSLRQLTKARMTSVNIALPTVQRELHIQPGNLQWVGTFSFHKRLLRLYADTSPVSAYTLSFGGFLLLAGVLADRYTKRAVFTGGMALLAVASLACGLASSEIMLMVCRALQGLGAAATVPSAIGVLSTFFRGQDRHRALSCYGAAGAVGFSAGLVLGGLVTGTIGWVMILATARYTCR
jgi:hypothetical protein